MTIHATAVALGARGVLLRGPSGAGKSDLALRLLALPRDSLRAFGIADLGVAALLADDRVALQRDDAVVLASAPPDLPHALEVRGYGLAVIALCVAPTPLALVVDLVPPADIPRLPDASTVDLLGVAIPRLAVAAVEPSAPLKIALAAWQARRL